MKRITVLLLLALTTTVLGEKIKIGLIQNEFTQTLVREKKLGDHLSELLEEEKLSFEKVEGEWKELHEMFQRGELDMLAPVERSQLVQETALFSENLYSQNFYAASNNMEIREITQLHDKKIYTLKNTDYKIILQRILKNADIKAQIIEVDDIYEHGDEIVALPETLVQGLSSKFRVGVLPSTAIKAQKGQEQNIARINKGLRNRYRTVIGNHKKAVEKEIGHMAFLRSLTPEEREYLKGLKELDVTYEEFSPVSTYSKDEKKYLGLTPLILEKLSDNLELKINVRNFPFDSWEKVFNIFKSGESDLLSMSKTENREKSFLFSKKIIDLKIHRITARNQLNSGEMERIGVLKSSIEEDLARKYYHSEDIVTYTTLQAMSGDFRGGKLGAILTFDDKLVDGKGYTSEIFHYVPINLAFSQKNKHLKAIFDKSLLYLIDKNSVIEEFRIKERDILQGKADMASRYSMWMKLVILLLCLGAYKIYHSKKMVELAFIDSLSKLGNRYSFEKFCESVKDSTGVAIVIDLDNFKNANDTYGHAVGDDIIAYCAGIFKKFFHHSRVFRISGDEYYAFIDVENHEEMLKKLKKELDSRIYLKNHQISCSIGYCIKKAEEDITRCFKHADMAMYQAKCLKGTGYFKATEEFIEKSIKDTFIRENIERCLEHEFYPVFQPKISMADSKKVIGAEALSRWGNPKMGIISPADFIPIAESMGIINKIDLKIAEESVRQLREWFDLGLIEEDFVLSCNVSMQTFETEDIGLTFEKLLKKYGVSGKNVELEITESIISKNMTETLEKLKTLKNMGISLSLDDFTAGHSTAGILPLLPIDIVKFDRSLILSMNREKEKGSKVYVSLINLIKEMGLTITAEGIERREDYDFLRKNGVEYAQGFLFGKPVKENEFRERFLTMEEDAAEEEIEENEIELAII